MKKLYFFFALALLHVGAFGQQRPQYTQYIFNNYLLNPAISGIENYIDLKAGHRTQWTGLEGAPVTNYISIHAPIGKNFMSGDANSFGGQDNNPMSRSYLQNYMAAEPHHGVGMHAVFDKAGPINRVDVSATYAYHLGLSDKLNIALGVVAGISKVNLDLSKIVLENEVDPAIVASEAERLSPDLGAGLWIYGPKFFVGLSAQQLLGQTLSFTTDETYNQGKAVPHYFLTAGYKIFIGEDVAAIPSVMVKKVSPAPNTYDANLKFAFRDKFWLGGSYRHTDSFSAMAGFNISYLLNLSYSYDFTTSELGNVSNGTHEIIVGLLLNNRYKVTCPQRNW
ncbi:MAG: type IX secretion system membrane protein PorP/SprF [Sphingobacteriaceae bacterium]